MALAVVSGVGNSPTSSTTSATYTVPTGWSSGQLLVASVAWFNPADAATLTAATGWTQVPGAAYHQTSVDVAVDAWQTAVFTKTYAAETGAQTVCTSSTAGFPTTQVASISGIPTSPLDQASTFATTYSGAQPAPAFPVAGLNLTQASELVLAALINDNGYSYATPTGWTLVASGAGYTGWTLFAQTYAAAGQMASTTFTANNNCDQTATLTAIQPVNRTLKPAAFFPFIGHA